MTAYTRSEIAELSINQLTNSELDEALTAFDGFSGIFARGWIDDYFHGAQSPIFVRSIMAMWKDFQTVSHLAKIEKLLERWRHGINQQGVSAELRVLAQLCRVGFDLELFPPVARREPDACVRVTREQTWTYVEVSQRAISELRSRAESVMVRISERAADSRPGIHSKIAVLRQTGADELERILRWLDSLPASGSQLEDLAVLYLESIETAVDANDVLYQHVPEPRLFNSRIALARLRRKRQFALG